MRVCAKPGCPRLVRGKLCEQHNRSQTERGYGVEHQRMRAAYQHLMSQGQTFHCWRCGDQIDPRHWRLGHDDDDRSRYRGPECVPCNQATSPRVGR